MRDERRRGTSAGVSTDRKLDEGYREYCLRIHTEFDTFGPGQRLIMARFHAASARIVPLPSLVQLTDDRSDVSDSSKELVRGNASANRLRPLLVDRPHGVMPSGMKLMADSMALVAAEVAR
jgi:hypothetical protein